MKRKSAKILVAAMLLAGVSFVGVTASQAATGINAYGSVTELMKADRSPLEVIPCWSALKQCPGSYCVDCATCTLHSNVTFDRGRAFCKVKKVGSSVNVTFM